jgi:phage-related minor tail protein
MGSAAESIVQLGEVAAEVGATVKEAMDGIQESIEGVKGGFEALIAAFAVEKIIEATGEAQQAMGQLSAVIRSTGGAAGVSVQQVQELSESLAKLSGKDTAVVTSMEAMLLSFRGMSATILPQASQAVMDLSARFGMDLTSAARLVGRAMADPVKGMTALSRAIGQLDPAQKNAITNFMKQGDVMDAQKVILDAIKEKTDGAAAANRDNLKGALDAVGVSVKELMVAIGMGDNGGLRMALEVAADVTNKLTQSLNNLNGPVNKSNESFKIFSLVVGEAMNAAGKAVEWFVNSNATWLSHLAETWHAFDQFLLTIWTGDTAKSAEKWNAVLAAAANRSEVDFFAPMKKEIAEVNADMADLAEKAAKNKGINGLPPGADTSNEAANAKAAAKAARDAAKAAAEQAREQKKIEDSLDHQSKQTISIMESLKNQLQVEQAKVEGIDSETASQQRQLQTLQSLGAIGKAQVKNAQDYITAINDAKKEQQDQKKVIDEIFKSTSNVFTKQQQISMAYLTGTINVKQYADAETRLSELQDKAAEKAIKAAQQEDKIGQNIIDNLTDQLKVIQDKVAGQKQLTPLLQLEDKINKSINDPTQRAQVLQAARAIQIQIDQQNKKYQDQLKLLKEISQQNVSNETKYKEVKQAIDDGTLSIQEAKDAMDKYSQSTKQAITQIQQFGSSIVNSFASAITGGQKFSALLKSLLQQLIQMIIKLVIIDTLMNAIRSFFTFGIGGVSAVSTAANAAKAAGSVGAIVGGAFASGGRPQPGVPYIVGENGPEVRIDDGPGSIYTMNQIRGLTRSNDQSGGNNAGAVTVQVMNNNGSQVNASATTDPNGNRMLQIYVDNAITKATKSGGALWNLLAQNGMNVRSQPS